ncbi:PaaI family thioesterase [Cupriavidus sp. 2TAF22]|uniref:PaaI family thioesterase n=1 Tax=unclassified Cupriavidus TaxID=2640874 RepID=UPI003F8FCB31
MPQTQSSAAIAQCPSTLAQPPAQDHDVPAGFEPVGGARGFARLCGGFYLHAQRPVVGVRIAAEHLNNMDIAHGGFLAMLADSAFGIVMVRRLGTPPARTLHLSVDYLGPVHAGDWVEAHVDLLKQGARVANVNCRVMVGERTALHAAGVFYLGRSDSRPEPAAGIPPPVRAPS